jgi:nitrate/nitrite transporter NarK
MGSATLRLSRSTEAAQEASLPEAIDSDFERDTYRRVSARLVPYLFLCYTLAYIDRVNVGFAKLQMQQDLGLSERVYGLGAGLFFIGYFLFEVPSNILLEKIGARIWIARIMIAWGIISAATMFVRSETSFYVLRFLLGVAEAGFFPGIIMYLTYWYTRRHRAGVVAGFMAAIAIAGALGGALSGWILASLSGAWGLKGWQWVYLIEGVPSVIVGIVTLWYLDDGPQKASWLSPEQRVLLLCRIAEEEQTKHYAGAHHRLVDAFKDGKVWILCFVSFGFLIGLYGLSFWLPQVVHESITREPFRIGLIAALPWAFGAVVMNAWARHSDRSGERRWHIALAAVLAAVAFAIGSLPGLPAVARIGALAVATAGILSAIVTFWAVPPSMLSGTAAAAGIAWINSCGNLGGYVSPHAIGVIREKTNSMTLALLLLAGFCCVSAVLVLWATKSQRSSQIGTVAGVSSQ